MARVGTTEGFCPTELVVIGTNTMRVQWDDDYVNGEYTDVSLESVHRDGSDGEYEATGGAGGSSNISKPKRRKTKFLPLPGFHLLQ